MRDNHESGYTLLMFAFVIQVLEEMLDTLIKIILLFRITQRMLLDFEGRFYFLFFAGLKILGFPLNALVPSKMFIFPKIITLGMLCRLYKILLMQI